MTAPDAGDVLPLSVAAGWNQVAADWRLLLGAGRGFGIRHNGGWIGSGLALPLGQSIWWISMLLVAEQWRRHGHGTHLLARCMAEIAAAGAAMGLDATEFGRPIYLPLVSIAAFVLVFIYTAYVLDPERAADRLAEQRGVIPGVEPGEATADHLDRVVSLTTALGAIYLVALLLIPQALMLYGGALPYNISGGTALIVVCTILDIQKQVRDASLTNPGGERR